MQQVDIGISQCCSYQHRSNLSLLRSVGSGLGSAAISPQVGKGELWAEVAMPTLDNPFCSVQDGDWPCKAKVCTHHWFKKGSIVQLQFLLA